MQPAVASPLAVAHRATPCPTHSGIFAQSVGGGGGLVGNVLVGPQSNFGSGLAMGSDATGQGTGGNVQVTLGSGVTLTTTGNSSIGIFAQSVGGGGGVMGSAGSTTTAALVGSGGGQGGAGTVQVTVNGSIVTSGDSAHGVFAQAAGGASGSSSTPANVTVNVNGSIIVSGTGADAVYAQSSGSGNGTVAVTVAPGATVQGGAAAVQSGEANGAGVLIQQGTSSTISNAGSISSVLGFSGVAITGVDTTLTITNTGTITGQVTNENATINLNNSAGGTLNAGANIQANVANAGTITVNGSSQFNQTRIGGNLTQSSTGVLAINIDFGKRVADLISVGGTASLGGQIDLHSVSTLPNSLVQVVSTDGGLLQQGIAVVPTALIGYGVAQTGNALYVAATSANFAPSSIALSRNEQAVASGLQSVWNAGGNAAFGPLFALLDNDAGSSGATYAHDLDQLSPGSSVAFGARQPAEAANFANLMLSCPQFSGAMAVVKEGDCAWVRIIGRVTTQRSVDGVPAFNVSNVTYQIGGQTAVATDLFVAGSLAFQSSTLNGKDGATGDGQSGYGGVALKWQPGAWLLAAAVTGSYGSFDTSRFIGMPGLLRHVATASPCKAGTASAPACALGTRSRSRTGMCGLTSISISSTPIRRRITRAVRLRLALASPPRIRPRLSPLQQWRSARGSIWQRAGRCVRSRPRA